MQSDIITGILSFVRNVFVWGMRQEIVAAVHIYIDVSTHITGHTILIQYWITLIQRNGVESKLFQCLVHQLWFNVIMLNQNELSVGSLLCACRVITCGYMFWVDKDNNCVNNQRVGRKSLRNWLNSVPDLIQDIPWEKGQHKIRYHQSHHQRQPDQQPFPIQVVTGYSNIKHLFSPIFCFLYLTRKTINNHTATSKTIKEPKQNSRLWTTCKKKQTKKGGWGQ